MLDAHHFVCHVSMCLACLWLHALRVTVCRTDLGGIQASSKVPRRAQQHRQHKLGFYQGGRQDPPSSGRSQIHVILTSGHRRLSYLHPVECVIPTVRHESTMCSHLVANHGTCNEDYHGTEFWTSPQRASVVQQMPGFALWITSKGTCVDAGLVLS